MGTPLIRSGAMALTFAVAIVELAGCAAPPAPDELAAARRQRDSLVQTGAASYAAESFGAYLASLSHAELSVSSETRRPGWMRDYERSAKQLRTVISMGDSVKDELNKAMEARAASLRKQADSINKDIARYRDVSESIAGLGGMRKPLAQAGALNHEARVWIGRGDYEMADKLLAQAGDRLRKSREALRTSMGRYFDGTQIASWQGMKNEAVRLSNPSGAESIVIEKLERKLTLFRGGKPVRTYRVGLGRKGFADKLHSGDRATPEGHYHIARKKPHSKYHKALLIDYPNDEDMARYRAAGRKGKLPGSTGIGGMVEIHGGGSSSLTDGCVSLDDSAIDELFDMVSVGTPVTIIGTTDGRNMLHEFLAESQR